MRKGPFAIESVKGETSATTIVGSQRSKVSLIYLEEDSDESSLCASNEVTESTIKGETPFMAVMTIVGYFIFIDSSYARYMR